jgi:uncharacterized protein YdaU (DUF1376 family)
MKSKSPAFQFYPSDFVSDLNVLLMTAQEVGAYLLLMSHCWLEGALPDDMNVLAHIARIEQTAFEASWTTRIGRCFELTEGGWTHPRLQAEREKQQAFSEKMRDSAQRRHSHGKQAPRRQRVGTKKAESRHQEGNALQSLSSSSVTTPISPSVAPPTAEHLVEAHYLATHPRRRVGSKDRTTIRRALEHGYTATDLCDAIDGNASDPWHRDKHKHELGYVLRDTGKIDDFRAKAASLKSAGPLVVDGWMSDELEKATRPPGLRAANG